MEARQRVEMGVLTVFRTSLRQLGGFVAKEICVCTAFVRDVAECLVCMRTQHKDEEVRGCRLPDRIGLRQRCVRVSSRELEQSDVVARVGVEPGELCVRTERHGEKELDAVTL